ncbi:hypothetical protein BKA56DRAFT_586054 [Ilyonectria sp. MPI-CAGE-AT-0026]|nr:hypothetical protein BKA56DRAFT_586054 [Ilyonectria sp. MPI-CAGE-AT-0026]
MIIFYIEREPILFIHEHYQPHHPHYRHNRPVFLRLVCHDSDTHSLNRSTQGFHPVNRVSAASTDRANESSRGR